jgi:hypothetical protein
LVQGFIKNHPAKKKAGSMALGVATAMPMLRAAKVLLTWELFLQRCLPTNPQFVQDFQHLKRTMKLFEEWVENEGNAV